MLTEVINLCEAIRSAGGRAMLVGGCVRDRLMGVESKDYDVEVYGLEPDLLRKILERIGPVNTVGESFAVYKLVFNRRQPGALSDRAGAADARLEVDVSIPRRESKTDRGHRGFVISGDPQMSFEEAARRRDFTINAILYDPLTDETVDPYNGVADFENRVLRAVAAETFVEDSLRVLRAIQLAARFEMTIAPDTVELCRDIDLSDLPRERIWGELEKLLTLASKPSIGLNAAREMGVLSKLFPGIGEFAGYSSILRATARALDMAAGVVEDLARPQRLSVMLAAFCHRLKREQAVEVLDRLGVQTLQGFDLRTGALALTAERSKPGEFYLRKASDGEFRRLARLVDLDLLCRTAVSCREETDSTAEGEEWFIRRARELGVEHGPPAPLLLGRHLLEEGVEPGPRMGELLRGVYELQLDGRVTTLDEALKAAMESAGAGPSPKKNVDTDPPER
jgi:tRNA nucleotidyltransferase (CCA-adding enzyme)